MTPQPGVHSDRNLCLCAGIRQLQKPIVKDIFSGAADVVVNLNHIFYCNL